MYDHKDFKDECKCKNSGCVCRIVKKIADAQDAVDREEDCDIGCKESIRNLVSPITTVENDTIPFILYCNCEPFIGQSVVQAQAGPNRVFQCIQSPIFRVSKVKKDCCAILELLLPVTAGGSTPGPGTTLCSFFPGSSIRNLRRTGVCITVDLCKFDGIACLEPVEALPRSVRNVVNTLEKE